MQFLRWYLTVLITISALGGCHPKMPSKVSEVPSKVYRFSGFTGVRASVAIDVELTQGEAFSVVAHTESGDFSGLDIKVEDGLLIATRPEDQWKGRSLQRSDGVIKINGERVPTYTVRVTAPRIDRFDASSSSIATAKGIKTRDLAIKASSSSDIRAEEVAGGDVSVKASSSADVVLSGTYDRLDIDASSSADVVLSGTYDRLDIDASSSADVNADNLTCQQGDLRASSGADIIAILTETVTAHARSDGDISVRGVQHLLK